MKIIFTQLLLTGIISNGFSQIKAPEASPAATISQTIGFASVTIEYNRPQLKGRDMFAELTREGEVWRTGANMSTRLTTTEEIILEGNKISAGNYSIYSIPGKKQWTVIINKKIQWGTVYNKEDDLLRVTVPTLETSRKVESFNFYFSDVTEESAKLGFSWGKAKVEVKIEAPVQANVLEQIDEVMADESKATDGDFFTASNFYLDKGLDAKKALEWANEFNKRQSDRYWGWRLQARALAANGKYDEAIAAAEKSTVLAREAGNMDYVFNNGKDIEDWKKAKTK
ncbi:MAG: DUF2911 domain-containing protein [Bacteroidetes bacterium]|nr:DUF2911 domain-containing protein [Bacteroidota bacterium]MDA1119853.1 DUF2911 domain-containing protein [Bacteroidota bacterium]